MYKLRVQEVARQHGLDQSKLARRADVAFKTVQNLWHNPHQDVQLSTLAKLARAMGVKLTDLLEDQVDGPTPGPGAE
jgi:transcriptional regulator with XRE-family HTH domain